MTAFCGLYVNSECSSGGAVLASQDSVFNGRPEYIFSFNWSGGIVNGRIYWSSNDNSWYVEDTNTQQIISSLPFDRIHPYGTFDEWVTITAGASCLTASGGAFFRTQWYNECPPTNFEFCCLDENFSKTFMGIQNFEYFGYFGSVFYLESPQFSGCATLIESSIPSGSIIYSSVDTIVQYNTCVECTGSTEPCYSQPIYTTPTPVPVLTADTGCGPTIRLVNECEPITVVPLSVLCSITNVSSYGGNNGSIELLISGGTPPYTISWNNGNTTPFLTNLTAGFYQYTVSDYYGDFVFTNGCTVSQSPLPTPTPPLSNICMTVNVEGVIERNTYNVIDGGTIPSYQRDDNLASIVWSTDYDPPYWILQSDLTGTNMVNYNPDYPPLTGWTWLDNNTSGFAEATGKDCTENGNFCMTINVNSFATEPYRIYFNEFGEANGKPKWTDNLGQYNVLWSEDPPNPSWIVQGLPSYATFTLVNSNPTVPPTNQWFVNGKIGEAIIKYDNCFSSRICASINGPCGSENIELVSGNLINGQQSWYGILPCGAVGDNWILYYNNQNNVWSTSGITLSPGFDVEAVSNNSAYVGPIGNYNEQGYYGLFIYDGPCGSQGGLKMNFTVNEPISDSDGNIIIEIEGGNQPYQYSIDNGTTYQNFPMFSNLKNGTYVITVRDNTGATIKQNVTLTKPANKISYQVLLKTTSRKTVNTVTTNTTEYTTFVTVQPPLPSGVTITFNLLHTDDYKVSPMETSSQLTLGTILLKNGNEIDFNKNEISTTSFVNQNFGCQNNLVYSTATTETWESLTITNTDEIKIITTVTNYTNQKVPCYFVENNETYSLLNVKISGCSNCMVVNQDNPPPPTQTPSKTPTPTPSKPVVTPTGT